MRTREEVVAAARSMLDTPFEHQGRLPGKAGKLDCIGLVFMSLSIAGFPIQVPPCNYERIASTQRLVEELDRIFVRVPIDDALPGDVLAWAFVKAIPQHIGFRTDHGVIHCWTGAGKVGEHHFRKSWRSRCIGAWTMPEWVGAVAA